jgi:hypothetical protein
MDWADYLRDEAAKYRQLAETAEDVSIKQELLDLAAVCEEAANNIEDRMPGGDGDGAPSVGAPSRRPAHDPGLPPTQAARCRIKT